MKLVCGRLLIDLFSLQIDLAIGGGDIGDSDNFQTNIDIFQTSLER